MASHKERSWVARQTAHVRDLQQVVGTSGTEDRPISFASKTKGLYKDEIAMIIRVTEFRTIPISLSL